MSFPSDGIPFARPLVGSEEAEAVSEVVRTGWLTQGPKVAEFEAAVAAYVGARFAIATSSCTTAMHLTLYLSGIGRGDEVIMPTLTCMATANAILQLGAVPVLVDVDARTFNIDPEAARQAVTERTKAVIGIHQFGLPAEMDGIQQFASEHDLFVMEDGALALGARYRGRRIGALGAPTCFSFHGRKIITTGEGGMITTDDEEFTKRARVVRSHGASVSDFDRHNAQGALMTDYPVMGYNFRMTDLQGAVGVEQMKRLPHILNRRQSLAKHYDSRLEGMDHVTVPFVPDHVEHSYQSYMIRLSRNLRLDRSGFLRFTAEQSIAFRHGMPPLHEEPFFKDRFAPMSFPVSEDLSRNTLILPLFPEMTPAQQDVVVDKLREGLERFSNA